MGKWKKRLLVVLGVLIALAIPGYWWGFLDVSVPDGSYSIDLTQVRKLASSMPGDKPTEIRFEKITGFRIPEMVLMAGSSWSATEMVVYAYQLVFPTHRAIVDTAMDEETGKKGGADRYFPEAFKHLTTAMNESDLIVVTHEHYDHIAGLANQPNAAELVKKSKITREQLIKSYLPWELPKKPFEGYVPFEYDRYAAIAPGVVLIRAPGHTLGSQLVYVQKADGSEVIFLGDVAWHLENVDQVRERARLVTTIMGEDRTQVSLELKELHRLSQADPKLSLVPGHDPVQVDKLVAQGVLKEGYLLGPIAAPDAVPTGEPKKE